VEYLAAIPNGARRSVIASEVRKAQDFHDRFIVLDENICVHVGASNKDAGKTAFMPNLLPFS